MSEQNTSFRIRDSLIVSYEKINEEAYMKGIAELKMANSSVLPEQSDIEKIDTQLFRIIEQGKIENFEIVQGLELLNNKINLLAQRLALRDNSRRDLTNRKPQPVSISTLGMKLGCDENIEKDTPLQIRLLLLPNYIYIPVYGEAVACREDIESFPPYPYRLTIRFDFMREEDQDKLIQHMLRKQSEYLRQKRLGASEGENKDIE